MSARLRHPSARGARGDLASVAARLCDGLRNLHVEHPELAAAALVVRGVEGTTAEAFGAAHGLSVAQVAAIESGVVGIDSVPAPLRLVTPLGALHDLLVAVPSAHQQAEGELDGPADPSGARHHQGSTGHGGDHRGARPRSW